MIRQLLALLAAAALLVAISLYGSHLHHPGNAGGSTHCDLCLQFGGSGGPPAAPTLPDRPTLVLIRARTLTSSDLILSCDHSRSHRSRAPPSILT